MAPNGTTSRKTPAPPKPVKSEDSSIPLGSLFDDLENTKPNLKEDVRKGLPVLEKPGNWESKVVGGAKKDDKSDRTSSPMNKLPNNLARAFPNGKLLADRPDVLKCNHCKRPVLKHAMPAHIERCLNKKQEKQRKKKEAKDARDAAARKERSTGDSDAEGEEDIAVASSKTSMAGKGGAMTASKKRKAVDEGEEAGPPSKKKKKKDADRAKAPRPKAPVDVEKQCGVELPQGGQCARSLTCKSHSMGAKRAVPGRSAPYDKLLTDYQRKNQAKLQKAAFDANAPNPDDDSLPTGPVDSDEETDAVMAAIGRCFGGQPIYQPQPVPLRSKYQYNRIKGMLHSAMGNRPAGGGLFGGGGGTGFFGNTIVAPPPAQPTVDADGVVHPARKGSVVPGARNGDDGVNADERQGSHDNNVAVERESSPLSSLPSGFKNTPMAKKAAGSSQQWAHQSRTPLPRKTRHEGRRVSGRYRE